MSTENAENRRNALKISLFGKTSKQIIKHLWPWKSWKYKQLWGLALSLVTCGKKWNIGILQNVLQQYNSSTPLHAKSYSFLVELQAYSL